MPTVHARCPQCAIEGDLDASFAGRSVQCRRCGTRFVVPSPSQVAPRIAIPSPAPAPPAPPPGLRPDHTTVRHEQRFYAWVERPFDETAIAWWEVRSRRGEDAEKVSSEFFGACLPFAVPKSCCMCGSQTADRTLRQKLDTETEVAPDGVVESKVSTPFVIEWPVCGSCVPTLFHNLEVLGRARFLATRVNSLSSGPGAWFSGNDREAALTGFRRWLEQADLRPVWRESWCPPRVTRVSTQMDVFRFGLMGKLTGEQDNIHLSRLLFCQSDRPELLRELQQLNAGQWKTGDPSRQKGFGEKLLGTLPEPSAPRSVTALEGLLELAEALPQYHW